MEGGEEKKLKMILFFGGATHQDSIELLPVITKLVNETYQYRDIGMEYIDCELPNNEELVKACAITGIPTVTYQAEDGTELERIVGIHPPKEYDNKILYYS